jgi:hypothetical protein
VLDYVDDELAGMKKNRRQAESGGLKNRIVLYPWRRVSPRGGFAQQIAAQRHDGDQHE